MQQAAAEQGVDPQRISFTNTLKIFRCRLPECPSSQRGRRQWHRLLIAEIGEEILPPRRNRINPRVIKKKISSWEKRSPNIALTPNPIRSFAMPLSSFIERYCA